MILKLFSKLFDKALIKFFLVGCVNFVAGSGAMFLCYNLLHFSYWVSSAINYVIVGIISFTLNRIYTFENRDDVASVAVRFVINIAACYLIAYGAARPLVYHVLSGRSEKVRDNIAMACGMVLFACLNYLGQRLFVFRYDSEKKREAN